LKHKFSSATPLETQWDTSSFVVHQAYSIQASSFLSLRPYSFSIEHTLPKNASRSTVNTVC
jgi:hypothetical protein